MKRRFYVYENGSFVGDVWAVSEKQAINCVRYRLYKNYRTNDGFEAEEV